MTKRSSRLLTALVFAAVIAQFVAGKAMRDALFLTSLGVDALPNMLIATALLSMVLLFAHARVAQRLAPRLLVPVLFVASSALYFLEWWMRALDPATTAVIVYLHVSIAGPLLASGFWLIASESFNPKTAKKGFGSIAGAGTLGGLAGALLTERVPSMAGVPSMLLLLGGLQLVTAYLVRRLAAGRLAPTAPETARSVVSSRPLGRSGLAVIAQAPHLRIVAALVLLGTTGAALLDYVFKARAVEALGLGPDLFRFFALYYAGISILSFLLQTLASRAVLERFGLGLTTSAPSIALLAGSLGSLIAPGFGSLVVARGGESVFRSSWFRSGYELFYTPMPAGERRAAKGLIDVGIERLGDAIGGGLVRAILLLAPSPVPVMLAGAMLSSLAAILAASHLSRWYVRTLERSLVHRAGGLDLSDPDDDATRRVVSRVRRGRGPDSDVTAAETTMNETTAAGEPPLLRDIRSLQSGNAERARGVLSRDECLAPGLVAHVIPLLAEPAVADYAAFALRKVAEERVGELTDALLDGNRPLTTRRRLAQVLSGCVSQRAADALMLALDDERFDVRTQAARSLAAIVDRNPLVRVDRERVCVLALREIAIERPVWDGRRLLAEPDAASPLDVFVRERAKASFAHVFTLLSLVLPREPLQIAFRGLQSPDRHLHGTALEYLDSVLPLPVRQQLVPYLMDGPGTPAVQPEAVAALLRASESRTIRDVAGWPARAAAGFRLA